MKVELNQKFYPRRGSPVKEGNVYQNPHGKPIFKIILGVVAREGSRPWNNVVMVHINAKGEVQGSSNSPEAYVRDHHDLMGRVKNMPSLKIEWLKEDDR